MAETKKSQYMPPAKTRRQIKLEKAPKNSTPGRDKGEACMASGLDKGFARRNRSHIDRLYPRWCEAIQKKYDKYK